MSKSVGIVTVYNSLNSGSFLQATALYKSIQNMGYNAYFLKTGARSIKKQALIEMTYMLKKADFSSAAGKIKMARVFSKELQHYNISADFNKDEDVFILGSDEIWNVARKNMAAYPVFWGKGLPLERCFSYAPSLNNATAADLEKYPFVSEALDKLYSLSVRDGHSKLNLEKITDREIKEVCDPTLLLSAEEYYKLQRECKYKDYILVYVYAKAVSDHDINAIIKFARKKNKKLIAFGSNFKWCDVNVSGTPFDFLSYIHNADYVCTSTFHGTIFSAVYQKQFAVLGDKNIKVKELLGKLQLDRRADGRTLEHVLEERYDRDKLRKTLDAMSSDGLSYINKNISSII